MQNPLIKCALEALLMRIIPFLVHNPKSDVFIRWPCMEPYNASLTIAPILLKSVNWSLCIVKKLWIKDIKLISLHKLWRRVVVIIVSLIVFIPLITCVNTAEIFRLPWSVLVMSPIHLRVQVHFNARAKNYIPFHHYNSHTFLFQHSPVLFRFNCFFNFITMMQ